MRFLVDRCAGHRLAEWLRSQGHDVIESRELGPDPGDRALLEHAAADERILVTIDTDFGELVYVEEVPHAGLVRLARLRRRRAKPFPDVPAEQRIALMAEVLDRHQQVLETQAIVTIRRGRIRISRPPSA
jgi:predicted nuclease of predicted toxin-antitoxin system